MTVCLTMNGPPSARHLGWSLHSEPGWVLEEYLRTLKRPVGNNNKGQQMKIKMSKQKKKEFGSVVDSAIVVPTSPKAPGEGTTS